MHSHLSGTIDEWKTKSFKAQVTHVFAVQKRRTIVSRLVEGVQVLEAQVMVSDLVNDILTGRAELSATELHEGL